MRRTTLAGLAASSHPEPVLAVTAMTTTLALAAGLRLRALLLGAAVLAGHLLTGWTNDLLDHDRDLAARRLDKPLAAGAVAPAVVAVAALGAGVAAIPLTLACGRRPAARHFTGLAAAAAYNLGLKRTAWSWAPYAIAFSQVPSFVTLAATPARPAAAWATVAAGLMGAGAHFAQSLPDLESDRAVAAGGLPARLGTRPAALAAGGLLAGAALTTLVGPHRHASHRWRRNPAPPWPWALGAALLFPAAVVAAAGAGRPRLAFRLSMASAGAVIVGLVASRRRLAA